jgi:hypothetical protein
MNIPRGKYIGACTYPVKDESEHFIKCGECGGWIDCRDLGAVFDHEGPSPHPNQDKPQ